MDKLLLWVVGMACLITGAVHYHAQLEPSKYNQTVGCLQWLGSRAFGPSVLPEVVTNSSLNFDSYTYECVQI